MTADANAGGGKMTRGSSSGFAKLTTAQDTYTTIVLRRSTARQISEQELCPSSTRHQSAGSERRSTDETIDN
jgi:hypothetical protein